MFYLITPDLKKISGGNKYDQNILSYLREKKVTLKNIVANTVKPNLKFFLKLKRLPNRSTLIIDGLIAFTMSSIIRQLSGKHKIIILVHHPVCYEDKSGSIESKLKEKIIFSSACKIITVSKTMSVVIRKILNKNIKIRVVCPAVDNIYHEKEHLPTTENNLISVGSIIPRKNIHNIIETMKILDSNWTVSFVGSYTTDQAYYLKVKSLVYEYNLESRVKFLGNLNNEEDLIELYNQSSAYICLSNYEGFGMSNLESAVFGLPLIVSDIDIFRETLRCYDRIYVKQNNPYDVAEHIGQLSKLTKRKKIKGIKWVDSGKKFFRYINE